jgi:hypothetical protein
VVGAGHPIEDAGAGVVLFVDHLVVGFFVFDWARQYVSHQLSPLLVVRFEGTIEEICCLVAVPAALAALAAVGLL